MTNKSWEERQKDKWELDMERRFRAQTAFFVCHDQEDAYSFSTGTAFIGMAVYSYPKSEVSADEFKRHVYKIVYDLEGDPQVPALAFKYNGLNVSFEARVNVELHRSFVIESQKID